jgi:hypothetical protein
MQLITFTRLDESRTFLATLEKRQGGDARKERTRYDNVHPIAANKSKKVGHDPVLLSRIGNAD